ISFNEALQYFQTADLSECRKKVRGAAGRRGLAALLRFLFGPPRLQPQLQGEWELALAMAQCECGLDNKEWVHMRILQTIYKKLMRSKLGCPRYGAHWEELGFQGKAEGEALSRETVLVPFPPWSWDPERQHKGLAAPSLSLHAAANFPFSIMSVNITHIVLQALREGRLSRECNRRRQVIAVLNELYAAAFLQLYRVWKQQHKTIADSGFLLKELELSTKKKPRQLLKSLEAYMNR
ncbi:ELMD3 protein, partial [Atlantisia rogersi]|nr:ELMD3 protein [Atlantisia rogersi]